MRLLSACLILLILTPFAIAKDFDAKRAKRGLDDVFSKSDEKAREKEIRKLAGGTLDTSAAQDARAHALELQRAAPKKLPNLKEAHEGALNYEYEVRTKRARYSNFALLDLPRAITADTPAPLVIGLHSALGTAWLELAGMRACMRGVADHPLRDCIIACPQALNRGNTADDPREKGETGVREYFGWGPKREGIDTVFNLLDQLIVDFNIDRERIYLVGAANMGGEACFHLAQLRPSQFAAICVRDTLPPCYYPELEPDADLEALRKDKTLGEQKVAFPWIECYRNTPVFWVHADADMKFPTAHARQARDEMKKAGVPLEYYEYEGFHASALPPVIGRALAECVKVKRATPTAVTLRAVRHDSASMGNDRSYWVEIIKQQNDPKRGDWTYRTLLGGKVTVEADRVENTLTITTDGVSEINLYLHDGILYLDREIKLVINGKERTVTATRSLETLARTATDMRDTGEAYTVKLSVST
jgi:dienelactone hydrolase